MLTAEQPWPPGDRDAVWCPVWDDGPPEFAGVGLLWFCSPETGERCVIRVSTAVGPSGTEIGRTNIWQLIDNGDGTVTVSPSVHFVGHFHSPNPVRFRLIDKLPDIGGAS